MVLTEQQFQTFQRDEQLKRILLPKIERLWMYDSSFPLSQKDMGERAKLIETICYTIANEWIEE
jgi:hypothetical protein